MAWGLWVGGERERVEGMVAVDVGVGVGVGVFWM